MAAHMMDPAPGGDTLPATRVTRRTIGPERWDRVVVRTPWIRAGDDLAGVLRDHLGPLLRDGDLAILSEKAATIAVGRAVPLTGVQVGRLAHRLASWVRPVGDSRGLSMPEKMQYVIDAVGRPRIVVAVGVAALTRPLGIHGAFYTVAGATARGMDGGRPPFEDLLLPPLPRPVARGLARSLRDALGAEVAIVDINDRGGSVRAVSGGPVSARRLCRILADNPLGQRDARTPLGLVRRVTAGGTGP
ncbi:MAG TPA: coenzyme F420-0:L-glutamate ligase [Euzebyales bacterium]|nr:coenzyme F420-0:L-glutamate ligase [Euzebyales bacterium]